MYKITNMDVLHLVAKIGNNTETNNNNNTYNNTSSNFFPNNIFNNRRISYDERNIRHRELAYQPEINVNEIKETIFQNLIQIKSILNCGNFQDIINPNNKNNINSSSLLNNNNINNKKTEEFDYNLNFYDLNKRTLQIGEWVDVKDTVENWLDAQVIDINESKKEVLIHYNGWNRRWDEWLPMNSPKIMPFRYHTRQTVITEYTSPFPNKRPNILKFHEKNNDNFLEIFSEIKEVNNLVFNLVEKINENNNNINFNIENNNTNNNNYVNVNNDNNKNDINNIINNNNDNKIDNNNDNIINNNNNNNIINAQNNIYFNLKRLLPIMDRLGRLFVDISTFFNYSINSRKLEDISKTFFNNYKEINDILKPFNENEQKTSNDNFLKNFNERERESGTINYVQCNNKFEEKMINKIPIIDTPYTVFKNDNFHHPIIDIYIRPYREPLGLRNNSIFHSIETNTNNNNNINNNNNNSTNNDTIRRNNDINNNNSNTNNLNNNNDNDKKNNDNSKDLKTNNDNNEKKNNNNDDNTYFENTENFNILSNNNNTNKNNNFYQIETNYNFSIIDSDSKIINNKEFINKKREREE